MRLVGFLAEFKADVAGKVLIGVLLTGSGFLQAFMVADAVNSVFRRAPLENIIPCLAGALAAIAAKALISRYHEGYTKRMAAKVKGAIRGKLLDKLIQLGPAYQNNRRSGNIQSLITDGVESFEGFLVNYIPQTLVVLLTMLAVVCYVSALDAAVGMILLLCALLSVTIPHLFMPMVSKIMIEYWQDYAHLNAQYIEAMQGMSTLKAFNASRRRLESLEKDATVFQKTSIDNTGKSAIDSSIINLCSTVGTSLAVALAALHTAAGNLAPASLLVILFMARECMRPLTDLNTYWHGSYLGFSVAGQLYAVLDAPVILKEPETGAKSATQSAPPEVTLRDVTFRYGEGDAPALQDVNVKVAPGQRAAIVGKSGAGKSTVVNLLLRFYEAEKGAALIGGVDVREYTLHDLREKIAVVFQDTYLFYGTIAENLRMARPSATDDELMAASKAANAHDFIKSLPQGYGTLVSERGATLSGGERQRISIARAILKNAPILILDEATSSVDVSSERLIQEALARLMENRTTIIIAHRLSTIEGTDNIFVLEDGRLREEGTHKTLLKNDGVYAHLVRTQSAEGSIG